MSKTPNYDAKVKTILDATRPGEVMCPVSGEPWQRTDEEIKWLRHFSVPLSDWSPIVRRRQLWGFNAGCNIWWNKHAKTGKPLLSYVHPDNPIKVLPDEEWHAEDWSREYSQIDAGAPFFPQMRELLHRIPMPAVRIFGSATNTVGIGLISAEDCFMVFGGITNCKRCSYGWFLVNNEDVFDANTVQFSRDSFGLSQCERMFDCVWCVQSSDCLHSRFLFDCRNCESCFGSTNLRNKRYVLWNKQLTKEEYEREMQKMDLSCRSNFEAVRKKFFDLLGGEAIWPASFNVQCEQSTGEYLSKCVRCEACYSLSQATDCYQCQLSHSGSERCAYASGFVKTSDGYAIAGVNGSSDIRFSSMLARCRSMEYCSTCFDCENCFGCIGLKQKKYHILNKPYSEEEYWPLVDRIKCAMLERGEYGRVFPGDFSPAGIEFATDVILDLKPEELRAFEAPSFDPARGTVVSTEQMRVENVMGARELPDCVDAVDPALHINKPILDPELKRPFSIRPTDLEFYRRHRLPVPDRHFLTRVKTLARLTNTITSVSATCVACGTPIQIAENPTVKTRKVYCEACYLKALEAKN